MKKILSIVVAFVLCLSFASVAFAADDQIHNGTLPQEFEQEAKITITGLHVGGDDDGARLPSEYHVRVKWDVVNGLYDATATDGKNGFQNFTWDCVKLQYNVTSNNVDGDVRTGNWTTTPKVAFEVTNASTPDLTICVSPSLKGTNTWANLLKSYSLESQNTSFGLQTVAPVLYANMGTGVNSYELNQGASSHNVRQYTYVLDWDYDALNALALTSLKNNSATQELTNTFVITISADQ